MTYLSPLMSGDASCKYQRWFKTHNKLPDTFDPSTKSFMDHTALLDRETDALKAKGYNVRRERQNYFNLRSPSYTIGGQPDLVTVNSDGTTGTIHEAKSGSPRNAHQVQTMLYMWALPGAFALYKNVKFDGRVVYQANEITIPSEAIDSDSFRGWPA